MSIIRVRKNKNNPYFIMNKTGINDKNLSLKAKGLLSYLCSKPDNWYINYQDLISSSKNKVKSIRSAVKELLITGYMVRNQYRNNNGKFGHYDLTVYEQPRKAIYIKNKLAPYSRKRHAVKPHADNRPPLYNERKNIIKETTVVGANNVDKSLAAQELFKINCETENTKQLLLHIGIHDHKKLFDLFPLSDIFRYATWFLLNPRDVKNPTGFLITAIKEKWEI